LAVIIIVFVKDNLHTCSFQEGGNTNLTGTSEHWVCRVRAFKDG